MAVRPEVTTTGHAPAQRRRRMADLGTRVLAAAVLGPCCLVLAWRGSFYFVLLVNLLALVATYEFHAFTIAKGRGAHRALGLAFALLFPWALYLDADAYALPCLSAFLLATLAWAALRGAVRDALSHAAATLLGGMYVVLLFAHLVLLRELPARFALPDSDGFKFVLLAFVLVWVSDTAAYMVGSLFGRHKLAPRISPGKSIEGGLGALVLTGAAGSIAAATFLSGTLSLVTGAWIGIFASVVGQLGDLVESMFKRDANIKDASDVIPGHGGVLDRFDSVLFVGPLLYYALRFFVL